MALSASEIELNKRFITVSTAIINEHGYTKKAFMESLGLIEQYYTRYKNNTQAFPWEKALVLSQTYNVSREWLENGTGDMFKSHLEMIPEYEQRLFKDTYGMIDKENIPIIIKAAYKSLYERFISQQSAIDELRMELIALKSTLSGGKG